MREEERIEGTDFTKRLQHVRHAESAGEMTSAMQEWVNFTTDPWEMNRRQVAQAADWLATELASKPAGHLFEARVDAGWYLEKIVMHGRLVDYHIERGAPSWAAHEAALLGEAWSELQLKLGREEIFLRGLRSLDGASKGGKARGRSDKILDRKAAFFRAYDDACRRVSSTIARQQAASKVGYNDDYARRLLKRR